MATASAVLNRSLRKILSPALREIGFQHVDARKAWFWREQCIWVFIVKAVGHYFSQGTGWPPGSVGVELGVYYTFAPRPPTIEVDDDGRLRPAEYLCHVRSHLDCHLNQAARTRTLEAPPERTRTDLWWFDPEAGDADAIAADVKRSLLEDGLAWYSEVSDLRRAFSIIERMNDCLEKFTKAALLARRIGDDEARKKYDALAEAEARRIGVNLDRGT
jgi:hypothetical protein